MARCRLGAPASRAGLLLGVLLSGCVPTGGIWEQVVPEQRTLALRDPSQLHPTPAPVVPAPPTVSNPPAPVDPQDLSLDQAIRIALANSQVVRVLAGVTATSSGRTIYDPAIANTAIDQERAAFDPMVTVRNTFNRLEQPTAFFDPTAPGGVRIDGPRVDQYSLDAGVTKKNILGGTLGFDVTDLVSRFTPGGEPLNPQAQSAITLSYTQPLLQGAGVGVNLAPIVIARINTEISYFQLKDSVQELVRGVVEAYWAVVFARTDLWARRQQVEQGKAAYERAVARKRQGFGTEADVAQARLALSNFEATRIAAEGNLLQREAALRNILRLSPSRPDRIIPNTPPADQRVSPNWDELVRLAEQQRPDLVELKLILEADQQSLLVAKNQAMPRLDATMLYRWNGLEGETPTGVNVSSRPGQFTDWTLGVNFSVPLGLRAGRAGLRRSELTLARDQANLDQGIHNALHALATSYRTLAQFYEEYLALKDTREAARTNLDQQLAAYRAGRTIFLNVVQAIGDWGNAVSAEAQILAQYNTELANLERQTGTILETHGVRFMEERFRSIGPLGRLGPKPYYPSAIMPGPNAPLYPVLPRPSEEFFDLRTPEIPGQEPSLPDVLPTPRRESGSRS
jgi:outer membrane protein TolC